MNKSNVFTDDTGAYGIDLGTTNSCISLVDNDGISHIIELKNGGRTLPSCVMWDSNKDEFIVGREAYNHRYQPNVCYSVKRLMGSDSTVKFEHAGKIKYLTPVEVSSLILKELVNQISDRHKDVTDVVITVPAEFNSKQIEDTVKAGELAGLNVIGILKEPTAASLVYRLDKGSGTKLVYDLGGGTFDVSIINIESSKSNDFLQSLGVSGSNDDKEVISVIATRGNSHLGGDDVDKEIFSRSMAHSKVPSGLPKQVVESLILSIEQLKKSEITISNAELPINCTLKNGKKYEGVLSVTVDDIVSGTTAVYKRTKKYIDDVLKSSSINIDSIVLVGGSTKSKVIKELLRRDYPNVIIYDYLDPDESVSLGAAVQAKRVKYGSDTLKVFDVLSTPIGVLADDKVVKLIQRNSSIPCSSFQSFSTVEDYQEVVSVDVYEGDSVYKEECEYLGSVVVKDLPKGKAGEVAVLVCLEVDTNGLLHCKAKCLGDWVSVELTNLLNRKSANSMDKHKSVMYNRWYKFANSLTDEKQKSDLISLIESSRVTPNGEMDVMKFISKIVEKRKEIARIKKEEEKEKTNDGQE